MKMSLPNNLEDFLLEIKETKKKYDRLRLKDRFNIFYALHKPHDEVNLHSRFISYLLAKDSGHLQGDFFARKFFEEVLKIDTNFLNDYEVVPNEYNKTEFKEIDILLVNKKQSHAIIIENKIFAKDSNHNDKKEGYKGQLERYYNIIKKGIPEDMYAMSTNNHLIAHDYLCKTIDVFYLTLNPPKEGFERSIGKTIKKENVMVIKYAPNITSWLTSCLKDLQNKDYLKKTINHYLILVKNMTNTNIPKEERNELKELFSNHLQSAQYIVENFNHVKWQTIDTLLLELKMHLSDNNLFTDVKLYPENDEERANEITNIAHNKKEVNIGVKFNVKGDSEHKFYISTQNNLSWGIIDKGWKDFESNNLTNIRFSDFSTDNTFNLISKENTQKAIALISDEILTEINNDFKKIKLS